ncbi:ferritin-like domain-containing protein [Planctomicrobium sp. SH664]|uniref:ferritin-like domain-containing protein n=1 Tax=Planctomicrobium sp. SH664 TaxID=3448125 RepID=UPI003F5B1E6C
MEIREFAEQVLLSAEIDTKLTSPPWPLTDHEPGAPRRFPEPVRPANLQFAPRRTAPALPSPESLKAEGKRAIAHHIMANHELQALEVMAWTLLAFPESPAEFRQGVSRIMLDEQRHTRMHMERAARLGVTFGSLPVNCYIWKKALSFTSVLDYLAGLPLVFEGANLDHTLELATAFSAAGDERSAALMRVIHRDEIEHVRFGIHWLRTLKPDGLSDWEAFERHLHWPLRPAKSRGRQFQRDARKAAGLDDDFIRRLEDVDLSEL